MEPNMFEILLLTQALNTTTQINTNIDSVGRNSVEEVVVSDHPGIKYEKFCIDKVEYLLFEEDGQVIIVPHFKANSQVVVCR